MTRYSIPTEPNRLHDEPGGGLIQFFTDLHTAGFSRDDMHKFRKADKNARRQAVEAMLAVIETPNWSAPTTYALERYKPVKIGGRRSMRERVDHICNMCTDDSICIELTDDKGRGINICHVDYTWQGFSGTSMRRSDDDPAAIEVWPWKREPADEWEREQKIELSAQQPITFDGPWSPVVSIWGPDRLHKCVLCIPQTALVLKVTSSVFDDKAFSLHLQCEDWQYLGENVQIRADLSEPNHIWARTRKH